jgi:hypothetical protein
MMGRTVAEMAEQTTILRTTVGSTIHGLHLVGTDDRDEMAICVEPMRDVVGFRPFEQFIYRSAAAREHKSDAPSQPGDLDLVIYSLRKWLRLALQGNPTVLTMLFVPPEQCLVRDARGAHLQEIAPLIVSRRAGGRYLGYLTSQKQRLLGERGQKRVHRPELEEKFGYDTKYAMHMLRLGHQGVELLTTGRLTLPMADPVRLHVRDVREGKVPLNDVLGEVGELEVQLSDLRTTSPLPEHPDEERVESWMLDMYFEAWKVTNWERWWEREVKKGVV